MMACRYTLILTAYLVCHTTSTCLAQSLELPAADPATGLPAAPLNENDNIVDANETNPGRTWQELRAIYTVLPSAGSFGVQDFELSTTLAFLILNLEHPLLVTPGAGLHLWSESAGSLGIPSDRLPETLYDLYVDFGWRPRLAQWLFADLGITPGIYTDFQEVSSSSFKLRGRGLGIVAFSERFQVVGGLLYVNRMNVKVLPAGGIVWAPSERTKFQILFPQPKISHQLGDWMDLTWTSYVAGEFGGGTWTFEQENGTPDQVDYKDIRVLLGMEGKGGERFQGHCEVGYAFSRTLDFTSPTTDINPSSTVLLRAGVRF